MSLPGVELFLQRELYVKRHRCARVSHLSEEQRGRSQRQGEQGEDSGEYGLRGEGPGQCEDFAFVLSEMRIQWRET